MGNLAGREDDQGVAVGHPPSGGTHRGDVPLARVLSVEGVDEEAAFAKLRDSPQEVIGPELHVRPDLRDQVEGRKPVDAAEGMVGDDHERSAARDGVELRPIELGREGEVAQGEGTELVGGNAFQTPVDPIQLAETQDFLDRSQQRVKQARATTRQAEWRCRACLRPSSC